MACLLLNNFDFSLFIKEIDQVMEFIAKSHHDLLEKCKRALQDQNTTFRYSKTAGPKYFTYDTTIKDIDGNKCIFWFFFNKSQVVMLEVTIRNRKNDKLAEFLVFLEFDVYYSFIYKTSYEFRDSEMLFNQQQEEKRKKIRHLKKEIKNNKRLQKYI